MKLLICKVVIREDFFLILNQVFLYIFLYSQHHDKIKGSYNSIK